MSRPIWKAASGAVLAVVMFVAITPRSAPAAAADARAVEALTRSDERLVEANFFHTVGEATVAYLEGEQAYALLRYAFFTDTDLRGGVLSGWSGGSVNNSTAWSSGGHGERRSSRLAPPVDAWIAAVANGGLVGMREDVTARGVDSWLLELRLETPDILLLSDRPHPAFSALSIQGGSGTLRLWVSRESGLLVGEEGDLSLVVDGDADDPSNVRLRYFSLYSDQGTIPLPSRFPSRLQ